MLAMKIIVGAVIGTTLKIPCDYVERFLLAKRDIEYNHIKIEDIIIHLIMSAAGAVIIWKQDFSIMAIYSFLLLMICEVIAVIDLHHRIIPNDLMLFMIIIRLIFGIPNLLGVNAFPEFNILYSLLGLLGGFVIFAFPAVLSKSIGAGDVKLAAAVGFCLGIMGLLYAIVLMGICVIAYALIQSKMSIKMMIHNMIPMGPFIAVAMLVVLNFY